MYVAYVRVYASNTIHNTIYTSTHTRSLAHTHTNEHIIYFSKGNIKAPIVTFNDYRLYDIHTVVEGSFDTLTTTKIKIIIQIFSLSLLNRNESDPMK